MNQEKCGINTLLPLQGILSDLPLPHPPTLTQSAESREVMERQDIDLRKAQSPPPTLHSRLHLIKGDHFTVQAGRHDSDCG